MTGKEKGLFVASGGLGADFWPSATGLTLLGITGIGKTAMMEMWMKLYPQMIVHTQYRGRAFINTQIVYLRLQCPRDGSIHALIENFFQAMDALHGSVPIDTNYQSAYRSRGGTVQELIPRMALLAAQHGLGLLILDEVQDLNPRGAGPIQAGRDPSLSASRAADLVKRLLARWPEIRESVADPLVDEAYEAALRLRPRGSRPVRAIPEPGSDE